MLSKTSTPSPTLATQGSSEAKTFVGKIFLPFSRSRSLSLEKPPENPDNQAISGTPENLQRR
jgi:hypothetical protein